MIRKHQRFMSYGYSIPLTMWWMFWPMDTKATLEFEVSNRTDPVTGQPVKVSVPNPVIEQARVERQFVVTNRDAWMAVMVKLGAVKPA
jgi:hypothetical protein